MSLLYDFSPGFQKVKYVQQNGVALSRERQLAYQTMRKNLKANYKNNKRKPNSVFHNYLRALQSALVRLGLCPI